ncbi:LacI family transcriptional regulator [Virgisporangium aliadipatigenens]|uniref:LacI family transcriptional regulator n=2 Tax=Virgisporangium aliadipatigenens TaxID=741659 RepID=A0A8J3YJA6_9ACTN|nr:LacI family DNA-binding transcriptional regulator [Virgisporangium aliadipatigenens]GIJ45000.1 LacI family transcriptional regulator [Virgisporangium aliadipatigenens]
MTLGQPVSGEADPAPEGVPADEPRTVVAPRPRGSVMRDVARLAGVSHQTVSRVLNEHPNVRQETRTRVLEAMRALNYRRNLAARTLVTRRSGTLGIVGYETTLFGPASMLYGIEDAARTAGYFVSVATIRTLERDSVLQAVDRLSQQSVEGIVAIAPNPAVSHALAEVPAGLPCVGVGAADTHVPTVRIDNAAGAALATRHLLDLGHRTVHHVAGPSDWPEAAERVEGWRGTLYAAGAIVPPVLPQEWTARSGYERGRILAVDPTVTAIFCANDQIALGVLRALHEAGRRVPDDVSVVGFDDMPDSGYFLPPLTTVRQDFAELGRRGIDVLLAQIANGNRDAGQVVLAPELVVRASTAAPRSH